MPKKHEEVGLPLPLNSSEFCTVADMNSCQVAAPAMIGPEYEGVLLQLVKGSVDLRGLKIRAVTPYNDDFLITEPRQGFARILQPLVERTSRLEVNPRGRREWAIKPAGREEVNIKPVLPSSPKLCVSKRMRKAAGQLRRLQSM